MTAPDLPYATRMQCAPPPLVVIRDGTDMCLPPGYLWTCPLDDAVWVVRVMRNWGGINDVQWVCVRPPGVPDPVAARLAGLEDRAAALATRVADTEKKTVTVLGARATTTALAVNGKVDLALTWNGAFPDLAYSISVLPAAALLGKVTATELTSPVRTRTGATVRLTATAAVLIASDVLVLATRYGGPT